MIKLFKRISLIMAVCFIFLSVPINAFGDSSNVNWYKLYDKHGIDDVTYGNGVYIAVGTDGIIKSSTDGVNWTIAESNINRLNKVVWGNDEFVAVGTQGSIFVSKDGKAWDKVKSETEYDLTGIAWNGSSYVVVGDNGTIITTDGETWTISSLEAKYSINDVVYGNGKFIATVSDTFNLLLVSEDGTQWNEVKPYENLYGYENLAYNGEAYIMWGKVPNQDASIALISIDGEQWTSVDSPEIKSIYSSDNRFIALGVSGDIFESEDGREWNQFAVDSEIDLKEILFLNNGYVAISYTGEIYLSDDLTSWEKEADEWESAINSIETRENKNIAYNGEIYVYVGGQGEILGGEGNISEQYRITGTSIDNITWNYVKTESSSKLNSVLWANNQFIAVGDSGAILVSSDGLNWSEKKINSTNLNDVVWNGSMYVAGGDKGALIYSIDALEWEIYEPITSDNITDLVLDGSNFIAVAHNTILKGEVAPSIIKFADIENHWAESFINEAASLSLVKGVDGNNFAPDRDITRAEFATIVVRALNLTYSEEVDFSDVNEGDWYYDEILAAHENGIIQGYGDNQIKPNNKITREEAMTILVRALNFKGVETKINQDTINDIIRNFNDYGDIDEWAVESAAVCVDKNIFIGSNGNLRPNDNITRAETAKIILMLAKAE